MSDQKVRRYRSHGYDPYFIHVDIEERCGVCGTLNVTEYPATRIATEPERFGGITIVTTGTTWALDPPNHPGVEGLANKDLQREAVSNGGCLLCGSGNFRNASGPGGNAPRV